MVFRWGRMHLRLKWKVAILRKCISATPCMLCDNSTAICVKFFFHTSYLDFALPIRTYHPIYQVSGDDEMNTIIMITLPDGLDWPIRLLYH